MTTKELVSKLMEADALFVKDGSKIMEIFVFEFIISRCPSIISDKVFVKAFSIGKSIEKFELREDEYGKTWAITKGELDD